MTTIKNNLLQQTFTTPGLNPYRPSKSFCFDMTPGVLYPIVLEHLIPKGRYKWDMSSIVHSLVSRNPILNGYKVRISAFFVPYRLYVPQLRLNSSARGTSDLTIAEFPALPVIPHLISFSAFETLRFARLQGYAPRSLGNMLHFPVGYGTDFLEEDPIVVSNSPAEVTARPTFRMYNALDEVAYWDIVRNYYMNVSDDVIGYIAPSNYTTSHAFRYTAKAGDDPFSGEAAVYFQDTNIFEHQFETILNGFEKSGARVSETPYMSVGGSTYPDISTVDATMIAVQQVRNGGLFIKSMPLDLINARVNSYRYAQAISRSMVSISDGKLSMQDLVDGKRLYDYFTKAAYTTRFDQWIKAEFGVDIREHLDIPVFLRTWSFDVNFQSLFASASGSANNVQTPVGSQLGQALSRRGNMTLKFNSKEYGDVMLIISIEPDPVYSQSVDPWVEKTLFSDHFTPSFDRMGMQQVPGDRVAWLWAAQNPVSEHGTGTGDYADLSLAYSDWLSGLSWYSEYSVYPDQRSLGYQPSWSEYTNSYSRAIGALGDPGDLLSTWVAQPYYVFDPVVLFDPDGPDGSFWPPITYKHKPYPYVNPEDALRPFSDQQATSAPFIFALNVQARYLLPISSNQISKL